MTRLSRCLLGPFQATLDGRLLTRFKSNKARALLAYVTTEADRPHRRETLAGLLWPNCPDRDALSNLRFTLSALRRVIDDRDATLPFLRITHDELQFNSESDAYVDVVAFGSYLASATAPGVALAPLGQAVALYRDSFMAGFSLSDSPAFEEWLRLKPAQFERQAHAALHRLVELHAQRGEHEQSQAYAWRQLELVPWDEGAHRQLMRALALSGCRAAALAQLALCNTTERASEFNSALGLGGLAVIHYVRADHQEAISLAEGALTLGEQLGNPLLESLGHWQLGFILFAVGDYTTAKVHLEQVLNFYDPATHHQLYIMTRGSDAGVSAMAYHACCLWCLGYPDQARLVAQSAIDHARRFNHLYTLADVLCYAGCVLSEMQQDGPGLERYAEELTRLTEAAGLEDWRAAAVGSHGAAMAMQQETEAGIAQMRAAIATRIGHGARCYLTGNLRALAEAYHQDSRLDEALSALNEALDLIDSTRERHSEAEVHRTKAAVLLSQGDEDGAEASLLRALDVARRQRARSWELRTAIALSRLWQTQGKRAQAHELLTGVHRAFTEGFSTPDLVEAQHLLDELAA